MYRRLGIVVAASFLSGLVQAIVLMIVVGVGLSVTADVSGLTSTSLLPDSLFSTTTGAVAIGLGLLGLVVALDVTASVVAARMSSDVLTRERVGAYRSYTASTWSTQEAERDGHLQELMSKNAGWSGTAMNSASNGAIAGCSLIALGLSAFLASPFVAAALVVVFGALLIASRPLASAVRRRTEVLSELNVDFANQIARNVGLARDIRTFDVEVEVASEVGSVIRTISKRWVSIRVMNRLAPMIFRSAALFVMLGVLLILELTDAGDLAALGTVVVIGLRALGYAGAVQRSYQELQNASPWLDQLWERTGTFDGDVADRGTEVLEPIDELTFADVGFRYRPDASNQASDGSTDETLETEVLSSLNFRVVRGEAVGIVGPSGAGKSTLVKLLLRLHDPESGDLLANGRSARTTRLSDWYSRVGYVPQDVSTFNGTVAENIAFFRPGVTRDQLVRAAQRAHLHEEIMAFPNGYDTPVGERLGRLSGGQRQRLALARALVGDPDVLVLDEPTSALDMQSETLVQETIDELRGTLTLFVIAHRISTLSSCEKIVVLENGRVTALDSPDRVRETNDFFREATRLARL